MINAEQFNISPTILVRLMIRPPAISPCFRRLELSAIGVSGCSSVFDCICSIFPRSVGSEKRWHVRLLGDTTWSSPPGSATFRREYVKPSRTSRRFRVQRKRSVKAWYCFIPFEASYAPARPGMFRGPAFERGWYTLIFKYCLQ